MDVFVYVLEGSEGGEALNVDVTVILRGEPRVVWNDPLVADWGPSDIVRWTVLRAGIQQVAFIIDTRVQLEWLRVMSETLPILQAVVTTGVNHAPLHGFEQEGLRFWVWPLRPHHAVDLLGCLNLVSRLQEDQYVHVGQTSFLELDRVDVGDRFAEDSIFVDVVNNGLLLHVEYPRTKVGTIGGSLTRKELSCDLRPAWVAGDSDEEVDLSVVAS